MTGAPVEFHLALRSEIVIEALPRIVWECIDRPREWKPSIVAIERIGGERGHEGEQVRVAQRPESETVYVLMQTVRLEPYTWRVQTLVTEASSATDGFVIYSMFPDGIATRLTCEVVARCELPAASIGDTNVGDFAQGVNNSTRSKLDEDLRRLKALAERGC